VGLVARHLEANGIATLILGSARDVVELCGVPRFLFSDFPLGNPCGRPYDEAMQREITGIALDLLESATAPRTTQQAPFVWSEDDSWKDAYARVAPEDAERIRQAGDARRSRQTRAKQEGV
jgi:D-proline reductase (dithiol) PrdB